MGYRRKSCTSPNAPGVFGLFFLTIWGNPKTTFYIMKKAFSNRPQPVINNFPKSIQTPVQRLGTPKPHKARQTQVKRPVAHRKNASHVTKYHHGECR